MATPDAAVVDAAIPPPTPKSAIQRVVVIVQENHTFDNHFGQYCKAPPGAAPTCTAGPDCCEAGPARDPIGAVPKVLDDAQNAAYSPDHSQACEVDEIDGGKMDKFTISTVCGSPNNFAYADPSVVAPYWRLAQQNALADRYFQPMAGQSSSNDMYFARARFVYLDNAFIPDSIGALCSVGGVPTKQYDDPTIADLLVAAHVPWAWYAEGYKAMIDAQKSKRCPDPPLDCPAGIGIYPCIYDASDVPFQFYKSFTDDPRYMKDLGDFTAALADCSLPSVSFVKGIGYKSEHPSTDIRLSDGVSFASRLVAQLLASPCADSTLVLLTYDEGGGYFDHVAPPANSAVDQQPYGTRVPMLAIGRFARRNFVSHVEMEHSSVVKFIEWNWLGGVTGQLGNRDAVVNNLGSLLDPAATGTQVPEQ
jgi:phospholipase C